MMSEQQGELPWWRNDPWLGAHLFAENRNKFPAEQLEKYNQKHVAWFPDGSGIRDADAGMYALWKRLEAAGDDPSWYCYEYVSDCPCL